MLAMRRLFRLVFIGGLIAGAWALLRELMQGGDRLPPQVSGMAESVEGVAKSAAETAKSVGETAGEKVSSVSSGGNGSADLSKAELYKEAQKLDVEGRSKMSKDELADAVARARRGGGS